MSFCSKDVQAGRTISANEPWRPKHLVDDDGLGLAPCFDQLVAILLVMERITASPVNELQVGEGYLLAVEVNGLSGFQKSIGKTCDRECRRHIGRGLACAETGQTGSG